MDRTEGLLFGGAALVIGALRRLEYDAVDMTRRDIGLRVRRRVGRGRRLARDLAAVVQLVIGVVVLVQGLRTAASEWSAAGDGEHVLTGTDLEPVA